MERQRHVGMLQPGQSGNPTGRPKSDKIIRDLKKLIHILVHLCIITDLSLKIAQFCTVVV